MHAFLFLNKKFTAGLSNVTLITTCFLSTINIFLPSVSVVKSIALWRRDVRWKWYLGCELNGRGGLECGVDMDERDGWMI